MSTLMQRFSAYVLASLFLLGIYLKNPVEIPTVPVHASTMASIQADVQRELKQKEIDKATVVSARLYRSFGCPVSLAKPTAITAVKYHIPVRLNTAVVIVESTCRSQVISKAGAVGLMQVMPHLHHTTRKALFDRDINMDTGTRFLADLVHRYGMEEGAANYFGITEGSTAAWDYAYKVMTVAGYRRPTQ